MSVSGNIIQLQPPHTCGMKTGRLTNFGTVAQQFYAQGYGVLTVKAWDPIDGGPNSPVPLAVVGTKSGPTSTNAKIDEVGYVTVAMAVMHLSPGDLVTVQAYDNQGASAGDWAWERDALPVLQEAC